MFFTTELLEKRDGGFGLLWLAATLGSKSTLKKLPRRDVLTADISQLCDLIMQPAEPLALRLTSNLMVGVARVYKVKQDIFMTDVTSCFNSLKKIVHELHTATDMQLQMAQPTLKSSVLTLETAKELAGFDFFVADWDDYLNLRDEDDAPGNADEDFNPNVRKQKPKSKQPASTEYPRTDMHTLQEHHEDFLSNSLDLSFNGSFVGGHIPSSSQIGGAFNVATDDFFSQSDGLDIGAVGDDLARELGEGWGASPEKDVFAMGLDLQNDVPIFDAGGDFDLGLGDHPFFDDIQHAVALQPFEQGQATSKKRKTPAGHQDDMPPPPTPGREPSTPTSFSRLLLSQDEQQPGPLSDITALNRNQENIPKKLTKPKKTRLLLDARTELTDEELKTARTEYLRGQYALKQELGLKKAEKDGMKLIEDILWGAPHGTPSLVDFWQENFKVQVEARTGVLHIHPPDAQSPKRRKIRHASKEPHHFDMGMPEFHQDLDAMQFDFEAPMEPLDAGRLRSSEEPGQGRNASRAPSVLADNFAFDFGLEGIQGNSQRSSLFPWDNAGASSSVAGFAPFNGSDRVTVDHAETRLRGSSLSRREDSLIPSQVGGFSPAILGKNSQLIGEDYAFDVDMDPVVDQSGVDESQMSDMNLVTLEKNSFNFLEYTRMQYQTLPATTSELTFDRIVPKTSSTRHVAATAFYHCLVLSTKKLLRVKQNDPYGTITIAIA